jgi:uncharacterized protein (TIGR01777 family)
MKIAISGASGLLGKRLVPALKSEGHDVFRLVRHTGVNPDEIEWDPAEELLDSEQLNGIDAVICLSGESIAEGRWSSAKKTRILKSRLDSVSLISKAINACTNPPRVLLCASAIGFYGADHGNEELDETSSVGNDFLADVCREWEQATGNVNREQTRVVNLRLGVVLSSEGGALAKMIMPFRLGLGGRLGSGQQWMSWVSIDDTVRAILFCIDHNTLIGPVNVTAPSPLRNCDFTRALAKRLHRFAICAIPSFAIRLALGEMGDTLLLKGARVNPRKLLDHGFTFEHSAIDLALHDLI